MNIEGAPTGILTKWIGILATGINRSKLLKELKKFVTEDCDKFLVIESPCGKMYTYKTANDVPATDVKCDCGDPNHWVIKYEEQ